MAGALAEGGVRREGGVVLAQCLRPVGTKIIPVCWTFGNFGGTLIINPKNGPLFTWEPNSGFPGSVPIPQAPVVGTGFFIAMPQQQIVVFGAAVLGIQDPMLVAWCDNANYNVWTASVSNQAGTYRLTRGSRIVGGIQGPQSAMLWTDVGMWLMQYIGYPDVYGFFEIAQGCGLIDQNGVAVQKGNVYWIGTDGFWIYAGGGVQRFPAMSGMKSSRPTSICNMSVVSEQLPTLHSMRLHGIIRVRLRLRADRMKMTAMSNSTL